MIVQVKQQYVNEIYMYSCYATLIWKWRKIADFLITAWVNPYLGDNCIQNFHLGRYIVGYTVGNLVLWRRASGAVKRDFRMYIQRYTSPNENFEYGYPHSNALLQFELKLVCCKPYKAARHPTKCDVTNDVKLFLTVYRRIYCCKFLTLSNQTSRYKLMCIRIYLIMHGWKFSRLFTNAPIHKKSSLLKK